MKMMSISGINDKIRLNDGIYISADEGAALSAYVPEMINGKLYELAFVYSMAPSGLGYLVTERPFAWLAVSSYSGDILFYNDCSYADFAKDYPLNSRVSLSLKEKLSIDEFLKLDEEFVKVYEKIREFVFADANKLSQQQKDVMSKYRELFDKVIAPDFVPYYKALSPEFFKWIEI